LIDLLIGLLIVGLFCEVFSSQINRKWNVIYHQSCYLSDLSEGITMASHLLKWLNVIYKHLHQHILCLTECFKLHKKDYQKGMFCCMTHKLTQTKHTVFYAVKQLEEIW